MQDDRHKATLALVTQLEGNLRNCEMVLFSRPLPRSGEEKAELVAQSSPEGMQLRENLSARQVAKIYGLTQKLLTKHIDQLGVEHGTEDVWYQEEVSVAEKHQRKRLRCDLSLQIKPIRKALVRRCNLILDMLEERNKNQIDISSTNSNSCEESVHNILIVRNVAHGSIYLTQRGHLYVPPSNSSARFESCQCAQSRSHVPDFLTFLEHVIATTQQRFLDDGILEYSSRNFVISSYDVICARISMLKQVSVVLTNMSINSHSEERITINLHHPHEAIASCMCKGATNGDSLRLLLSEEGNCCHVSLVSFGEICLSTESIVTPPTVLYQDKILVKTPCNSKRGGKQYIISAAFFVSRIQTEVERALRMRRENSEDEFNHEAWSWQKISSVHFIEGDKGVFNDESTSLPRNEHALLYWLENEIKKSFNPTTSVSSHPHPANAIDLEPTSQCTTVLGTMIGIRADNFVTEIKEESSIDSISSDKKTYHQESTAFIPFLEPSQKLPARTRHRVHCKKSEAAAVLDVVEERRCSYQTTSNGAADDGCIGRSINSLMSIAVFFNCKEESDGSDSSSEIDFEIELIADLNRNISIGVVGASGEVDVVVSSIADKEDYLTFPPSNFSVIKSIHQIHSTDVFVREIDKATRWNCDELATDFKQRGNIYMKRQDYVGAVEMYSNGLYCASSGEGFGILASNRCAAYTHLNALNLALTDAKDCVRHCPMWEKGWSRLGSVLFRLKRLEESLQAYEKATSLAPTNATVLDAQQEVRDVLMVREAEAAALEAKKKEKSREEEKAGNTESSKECNDVCLVM